jgi:hypothetical protein
MGQSKKQPTCAERVESQMESRLADLRLMIRGATVDDLELIDDGTLDTVLHIGDDYHRLPDTSDHRDEDTGELDLDSLWDEIGDNINEELRERFHEYALAFDYVASGTFNDHKQGYFRYQISYGGPSEEFRFYCDPGFVCYRVEFWFLDWFDGASRTLHGDDKALMLEVYEQFDQIGTTEHVYKEATEG